MNEWQGATSILLFPPFPSFLSDSKEPLQLEPQTPQHPFIPSKSWSVDAVVKLLRNVFPSQKKSCKPKCWAKGFISSKTPQNTEPSPPHWDHRGCIWVRHPGLDAVTGRFNYPAHEAVACFQLDHNTDPWSYFLFPLKSSNTSVLWGSISSYSWGFKLLLIRVLVPHWDISSKNMNTWRQMLWINNITIFLGIKMTIIAWKALNSYQFCSFQSFLLRSNPKKRHFGPSLFSLTPITMKICRALFSHCHSTLQQA